jgi:hypothetical protein
MHRIAQVVQQLANDLALVFLLYAVQNGRIGRRGGDGKARFQMFISVGAARLGTNVAAGEFPDSLKKLPAVGKGRQPPR